MNLTKNCIAICQHGHIGIITSIKNTENNTTYYGKEIYPEYNSNWQSCNPEPIAHLNDYKGSWVSFLLTNLIEEK